MNEKESDKEENKDEETNYDDLKCLKVSPPKSQAPGINADMFPSHSRDRDEEEDKSSINNEILRAAQPVTSVINFQDADD